MGKILAEIHIEKCQRCGKIWRPRVDFPRLCSNCKSPLWNKPRVAAGEPGSRNKYGFDRLEVGKEEFFPWFELPDGNMDVESNTKRSRSLEQFMSRHGYTYYWRGTGGGLYVCRRS